MMKKLIDSMRAKKMKFQADAKKAAKAKAQKNAGNPNADLSAKTAAERAAENRRKKHEAIKEAGS